MRLSKHFKFAIFNKGQLLIDLVHKWLRQSEFLFHFSTFLVFLEIVEVVKCFWIKLGLSLSEHDLHLLWIILPLLMVTNFLLNLIICIIWVILEIAIKDKHPVFAGLPVATEIKCTGILTK